jgi:hypothetical protein
MLKAHHARADQRTDDHLDHDPRSGLRIPSQGMNLLLNRCSREKIHPEIRLLMNQMDESNCPRSGYLFEEDGAGLLQKA